MSTNYMRFISEEYQISEKEKVRAHLLIPHLDTYQKMYHFQANASNLSLILTPNSLMHLGKKNP